MKKKIDERQEQELLKSDHMAFQIMFFVSVIVILVQLLFMQASLQQLIGENVILLSGGIAAIWGYVKNGLWSYDNSRPSNKSNAKYAGLFSFIATLLFGVTIYGKAGSSAIKATTIVGFLVAIFVLGFTALSILGRMAEEKEKQ